MKKIRLIEKFNKNSEPDLCTYRAYKIKPKAKNEVETSYDVWQNMQLMVSQPKLCV